jgi:hypothetical protein
MLTRLEHGRATSGAQREIQDGYLSPLDTLPKTSEDNGLGRLRDAMALLESKATAGERHDYRRFVLTLAGKVAAAHREHGQSVSPARKNRPSSRSRRREGSDLYRAVAPGDSVAYPELAMLTGAR